jgi:hypothetical protein
MVRQYVSKEDFKEWARQAYSSIPAQYPEIFVPQSMEQVAKQVLGGTPMADRELTWEEMLAQITDEEPEPVTGYPTPEPITETPRTFKFGKMSVTREAPQPVIEPEPTWTAPSYDELTQALPIVGMAVMLNAEGKKRFPTKFHGIKGIIVDQQGSDGTTRSVIRKYKATGYVEGWEVSVRFDNGETRNVHIKRLEKVPSDKNMVKYTDDWDGIYRYFEEGSEAERDMLDERAIIQKMPLQHRQVFTKAVQEKKYNDA